MKSLRANSIKNKLIIMILFTTVITLIAVSSILVVVDVNAARQSMEERLSTLSRVIADRSTAALTFNDPNSAKQMLSALQQDSSVVMACTFDLSGKVFTSFESHSNQDCVNSFDFEQALGQNSYYSDEFLHLTQAINLKGNEIGRITIVASLQEISGRFSFIILTLIILTLVATIASFFIANKLQRFITDPLLNLRDTVEYISNHGDYSRELPKVANDEIGDLYESFSRMMDQIRIRDNDRQSAEETLRASKKRYQTLVEYAPFCINEVDLDGNIISMNPAGIKMMGVSSESEVFGIHYLSTVDDKDQKRISLLLENAINGKSSSFEFVAKIIGAESSRHFASNIVPIKNAQDKVIRLMGITSDITQQKNAELSLRRSQKMEAVGQLTGGIAHDFNNILGIISGNLELLEYDIRLPETVQKRISVIKKAATRAAQLTHQLLGFSSTHAVEKKVFDINQLIEQMRELIVRSMTPKIQVEWSLLKPLWLTNIDSGDFEDALLNMVINAKDAIGEQGILSIETKNIEIDREFCDRYHEARLGNFVKLSITDDGCGMTSELQERIFEPFFTTKERGKGTGLGLSMVFGFVNRSNGFILFSSELNKGSEICIYLPRASNTVTKKIKNVQPISNNLSVESKAVVLVVDDEIGLLDLAKESLKNCGYKVLTATNGAEAIQIMEQRSDIDLLFSDVVMPGGISGFELVEKAIEINPRIKTLVSTGFTSKRDSNFDENQYLGIILNKPYRQDEMLRQIGKILNLQMKNNDNTEVIKSGDNK